jgi:hypothetical protein
MILNITDLIKNATQIYHNNDSVDLRRAILEGKVLVDRHSQIVTTIFINPKFKDQIKDIWGDENGIWGADVNYFNDIPENKALLFAFEYDFNAENLDINDKKLYSVINF